jgi:hypothetical protein
MKPNLLEQLIKKALLEQAEKTVIIGPMSKSGRNDVIAAGGITGFTITMKYRGQAPPMESVIQNIQSYVSANSQIGAASSYDIKDKSDDFTSRYMYVIGDDIAKSKRVLKMNVWVLLYSPLLQLADQLDSLKNNDRFQEQITGVIEWRAGGIPVYTYNDAAKWISILKMQSSNLKLDLIDNQLKKKIAFPSLTTINKQELDQEKISGETKVVTIDNTNRKEYSNTDFTGTAEMSYDAYGIRKLTYINGSCVVSRTLDGTPGIYTGEFKNGMPSNGKAVWDDGEVWEGEMSSSAVKDPDTGFIKKFSFKKSENTIVSNSKQSKTSRLEYPYTLSNGNIIYTLSDTDKWVYLKDNDEWVTTNKIDFERFQLDGGTAPNSKVIPKTETDVYAKLDSLVIKTPGNTTTNNSSNLEQPTTNNSNQPVDTKNTVDTKPLVQPEKPKTDKNKTTVEFLNKEKSKKQNGVVLVNVSKTPIYTYKNKKWVKAGSYDPSDGQYISYLGNSTDYKYIRVKFVKDNKIYWIPTSSVK